MNENKLWSYRFSLFLNEILKYMRYILTGHFTIVLIFLAGWGAFEYQKWLQVIQPDFPAELVAAVVITLFVLWSPIQTYLKNADVVFLTPMEARMKSYIIKSLAFSFAWQSILVIMIYLGFVPLLRKVIGNSFNFWPVLVALLITKLINIIVRYFENNVIKTWESLMFLLCRVVISFGIIFSLLKKEYLNVFTFLLVIIMLLNIIFNLKITVTGKSLPWLKLIENDNRFISGFYRFANLFTDVPHLLNRVKDRKWLNFLLINKNLSNKKTLDYLFLRTFIRANDYFSLFLRITFITAVILIFTNPGIWSILLGIFSIYLVGFQLLPLAKHHEFQLWLAIYPINENQIKAASLLLLRKILLVQNVILSIIMMATIEIRVGLMSLFACIAFILIFLEFAKTKI